MLKLILLLTVLVGCGSESGDKAPNNDSETSEKAVVLSSPDVESIALDAKSDLPSCSDDNRSQLAYIVDEDNFYVCRKDWTLVSIRGKAGQDGEKGDKGDTGATGATGQTSNSSNVWVDTLTGFTWYLGGTNTHAQAETSCTGDYRLPTIPEAYAAITHGIRLIAGEIGANLDFWTSEKIFATEASYYYATINAGNPVGGAGGPAATYSVFCVK